MNTLTIDLCRGRPADGRFRGILAADVKRFEDGLPAESVVINASGAATSDRLKLAIVAQAGADFDVALAGAGGLFIVMANALPGRMAEFERFYVERHMDDMLRLDGVQSAILCRNEGAGREFVSLFPLSDCETARKAIAAARGTPGFPPNPETDRDASRPGFYDRFK